MVTIALVPQRTQWMYHRVSHGAGAPSDSADMTCSMSLRAVPVSGGPSHSHRCMVLWFTPKRAAKTACVSRTRSRANRSALPVISMWQPMHTAFEVVNNLCRMHLTPAMRCA